MLHWVAGLLVGVGLLVGTPTVRAQTSALVQARPSPVAEAKPRWQDLQPTQRQILMPLEREWQGIDAERKQKWLAIAAKYPSMLPQEQARVQERMADWARLSPAQRGLARQQFQNAKRVAPQDRPAQWEAYQALPAEQKRQLANQALAPATGGAQRDPRSAALGGADGKARPVQGKSNIVPNPALAGQPTPITSAVVQAQPGATTTSIAKRATPPAHQQPGLPKIAASPGFVDKTTLLPKRGAQAAAIRSSAASEPLRQP
jgi:Protein of unknown function (DUF3106)